jgi:hypothetical protein
VQYCNAYITGDIKYPLAPGTSIQMLSYLKETVNEGPLFPLFPPRVISATPPVPPFALAGTAWKEPNSLLYRLADV